MNMDKCSPHTMVWTMQDTTAVPCIGSAVVFISRESVNMTRYLILCRSLTHAQRSARLLERSGITATVVKAELSLSAGGCRYGIELSRHVDDAIRILKNSDMIKGKICRKDDAGNYAEVRP